MGDKEEKEEKEERRRGWKEEKEEEEGEEEGGEMAVNVTNIGSLLSFCRTTALHEPIRVEAELLLRLSATIV